MVDQATVDSGEELPLSEDYEGARDLPVEFVVSADGTKIAYEKVGSGPPVVVVGAGLNDRAMFTPLATIVSQRFTVYNYDRRGRGDSDTGDPQQWTIQREIEDLAAVLDAVGEPSHVFANCTGGMIAILAAASGVPMATLSLYEPPYWSPTTTDQQLRDLKQCIAEDRADDAVTIFARDIVGFITDDSLEEFKQHPAWSAFQTMVPSTYYDAMINRHHLQIPYQELPKITVPTLVMRGDEGPQEIRDACARIAQEIPQATLLTMSGHGHLFNQKAWSPMLMAFLESPVTAEHAAVS
jgi:pimeloyl-ACP methyl ester carboxylesterase